MFLVVIKGGNIGSILFLNKFGPTIIGRGDTCDARILDLRVSRKHCQIKKFGNNYFIEDLYSANKTIVNGKAISGRTELKNGDNIKLGNTMLRFSDHKSVPGEIVDEYSKMSKTKEIDLA